MSFSPIPLLMFSNLPVRGGAEEHLLMLLQYLDRRYFRLHLACGAKLAEALRKDLPADIELFTVELAALHNISGAVALRRMLRSRNIQILHSHMFWSSLFASPVGWLARVPVIIETTHVREQWRKGWKANYWMDRLVGRCVDRYIAVSNANGRYLREEKGIPSGKVTVIQNGSDLTRFNRQHRAPWGMKESLGFGPDDPILLVVARLEEQKGHRVLLQAMPLVLRQFPTAKLVCVGDGVLRGALEKQVQDLGIAACVRLMGYQSNITDWLAMADVAVLPSFYEGLPLVVVEALAAGKPIVATAVDGTPEIVIDGKTGLLVPPGDAPKLADALCLMLRDSELRQSLASAGHDFVRRQFSRERQLLETEECYLRAWEQATGNELPVAVSSSEALQVAALR